MTNSPSQTRHSRKIYHHGPAKERICEFCRDKAAYDWATIHGRTGEALDDYMALCRGCHMRYDPPRCSLKGSRNPSAKLSEEQVQSIRSMIAEGASNMRIAELFAVNHRTISRIRRGKGWKP